MTISNLRQNNKAQVYFHIENNDDKDNNLRDSHCPIAMLTKCKSI